MNKKKVEKLIKQLIEEIDPDPDREGLRETPQRVAAMYAEIFEGARYTNDQIAEMFDKCFEEYQNNDLVLVKDIECSSYCEHHMALIYNLKISVAYLPAGKLTGLSKIARIADMACRRLQLQERIGTDINYIMRKVTGSQDVAVIIEGEHSCMTTRGIRKGGATRTASLEGLFKEDAMLRNELYQLLK
jgi:GTP cyclohydrolase I